MKRKILSTTFGLMLTLSVAMPINPAFLNAGAQPVAHTVTQSKTKDSTCTPMTFGFIRIVFCDGMLQSLGVSWNSGGG